MTLWQEKAARARSKRDASIAKVRPVLEGLPTEIPQDCTYLPRLILTKRELEITEGYSIVELVTVLRERKISVEEVTRAFLRRAAVAHFATNCLTELLWDEAITRAKQLDALSQPTGALFGMPISVKEHLGMVGPDITTNAALVGHVDEEHSPSVLVAQLWATGCVFIARTTLPQAAMSLETNSNIYGRTTNPYNHALSSGGSSGGEAALIAMRGSLLGLGSDIGGSIRVPAAHVGIYGFKPTSKRISAKGVQHYERGKVSLFGAPGPMASDRTGLEMLMKIALAEKPWLLDDSITPTSWQPFQFHRPLKIGVQWWDGIVKPHPPILRALREVVSACSEAGMKVVDWNCEDLDHQKGWEILTSLYWPDGGRGLMDLIDESGEPVMPLTSFILQEQEKVKDLSEEERIEREQQRAAYQQRYAKAWEATAKDDGREIDVLLCPPSFGCATPHDQSRYWGYSALWNLLDYPGAVFPVTTVDPKKDPKDETYLPRNEQDTFVHEMYWPERYIHAPVSLQVVGQRHGDEKVLAALVNIERAMGRR